MAQVISLSQVKPIVQKLRAKDKTIVLATGVFDLLHAQHRRFLLAAKQVGDTLLVGVETDARVKKLKGPDRPVWKLPKRLEQLAKLPLVDYVFALPEQFARFQDHEAFIAAIRPDILAISGHTSHQAVKQRLVEQYGGKLQVVLSYNSRVSTSQLIRRKRRTLAS